MKLHVIIVAIVALLASLSAQQIDTVQSNRVLLAMEPTPFKKILIKEMTKLLEQENVQITLVEDSEKNIKEFTTSDYDLIFITNSGVRSQVRPWITEWIDAHKADSAKILLHTTKKFKWEEDVYVDAVSSASSNKIAAQLAEEYVKQLLGKL